MVSDRIRSVWGLAHCIKRSKLDEFQTKKLKFRNDAHGNMSKKTGDKQDYSRLVRLHHPISFSAHKIDYFCPIL